MSSTAKTVEQIFASVKYSDKGGMADQEGKAALKALLLEGLPQPKQTQEWSEKHQRFIIHRPEAVDGYNAAIDEMRQYINEVCK